MIDSSFNQGLISNTYPENGSTSKLVMTEEWFKICFGSLSYVKSTPMMLLYLSFLFTSAQYKFFPIQSTVRHVPSELSRFIWNRRGEKNEILYKIIVCFYDIFTQFQSILTWSTYAETEFRNQFCTHFKKCFKILEITSNRTQKLYPDFSETITKSTHDMVNNDTNLIGHHQSLVFFEYL